MPAVWRQLSLPGNSYGSDVESFDRVREVEARCRSTLDRVHSPPTRDSTEARAGGTQSRQRGPPSPCGVVDLDLLDRARDLLSAEHHNAIADRRSGDPAARFAQVRQTFPSPPVSSVAL